MVWKRALTRLIDKVLHDGTLAVTWPDGYTSEHGKGAPRISIALTRPATLRRLVLSPEVALGEAYMDETLRVAADDLYPFMAMIARNAVASGHGRFRHGLPALMRAAKRLNQNHGLFAARRNVEHHYDLSPQLYEAFLDADLQYTCGYFPSDNMSIEAAQAAKKAHIAAKLRLEPGMRVMDIGCGWGGLAITLARDYGCHVTGITLSNEQKAYAEARARAEGLADRVEIRLTDYRHVRAQFDRITVVGMLEHVGQPQYDTFFATLRRNLAPDGVALVHTCGRSTPPNVTAPWIGKYIFPGSYIPAMSEVLRAIEPNDLIVTDIEVWRTHYIKTLQAWRARFEDNRDRIETMYDARFIRMWRYYLVISEVGFAHLSNVIFQFQITRDPTAVPITRDYLWSER